MKQSPENIKFIEDSYKIAFDKDHSKKIKYNIQQYENAVKSGKKLYAHIDKAKERAGYYKQKVINELDSFLIDFEDNFTSNGGKVLWAQNSDEAIKEVLNIIKDNNISTVVKSKSMATEEINLNDVLENNNIDVVETDLGEFIVQQAGQKPYHIVTPAMHMSKDDVADLYNNKFGTSLDLTAEQLTKVTRELLREKFVNADLGITGANFLVADTGSIALTENEGNILLSMSFPKIHIVITGIEKVIPKLEDLDLYWPLLATHGTGQRITSYNSIINGPKKASEIDGPEKMYVVLLDNGRTNLLKQSKQRQALTCIKCGACLNACPVYKNIGGHTYNSAYSGPIGAVTVPFLSGMKKYKHLSFASTLCGSCTEVCPVNIPIHELLIHNRNHAVKKGYHTFFEKQSIVLSSKAMKSRSRLDFFSGKTKNKITKITVKKKWGNKRELPQFEPKSFSQLWKEENDEK